MAAYANIWHLKPLYNTNFKVFGVNAQDFFEHNIFLATPMSAKVGVAMLD